MNLTYLEGLNSGVELLAQPGLRKKSVSVTRSYQPPTAKSIKAVNDFMQNQAGISSAKVAELMDKTVPHIRNCLNALIDQKKIKKVMFNYPVETKGLKYWRYDDKSAPEEVVNSTANDIIKTLQTHGETRNAEVMRLLRISQYVMHKCVKILQDAGKIKGRAVSKAGNHDIIAWSLIDD